MSKVKLIKVVKSKKSGKKYEAIFENESGREKHVYFGQAGASDYTKHKDRERRNKYIFRHMKDTKTGNPTRAGFLSLYILWNKPSFSASLADYKKRLNTYNRTGKFPTKITGYVPPSGAKSKFQKRRSPKKSSRRRSPIKKSRRKSS
jgi:hypothetical protein